MRDGISYKAIGVFVTILLFMGGSIVANDRIRVTEDNNIRADHKKDMDCVNDKFNKLLEKNNDEFKQLIREISELKGEVQSLALRGTRYEDHERTGH